MGAEAKAGQRKLGWGFSFRKDKNGKMSLNQSIGEMAVFRHSQDLPSAQPFARGLDEALGDLFPLPAPLLVNWGPGTPVFSLVQGQS